MHHSRDQTIKDGLIQTCRYRDQCGAQEAHLIIIDKKPDTPWENKIFLTEKTYVGTLEEPMQCPVTIWGM
jgi:hypothetical protein